MALTQSALILLVTRRDPQDPVRRILRGVGYRVVSVDSVPAGIRTAERNKPAVIVADPRTLTPANRDDLTSFASENHIPLISSWSDPNSLLAQVEPLLGTPEPPAKEATQLTAGPLRVDFTTHVATIDDRLLDLTAREFDLLCQLARHPGWVWSRQELLEHVWGYDCGDPRVVTVHVGNLRKKLEAACPEHSLIETVRNIGYKFVVPTVGEPEASATDEQEAGPSAGTPTGPESLADERRLVTILFLHVAGLTALAESGESLRELVNLLSERLVPCVERYGGGIHRLSADSAMALFGAPVAHDNDAEAAVRAARDIVSAVSGFDAENPGDGLTVHVGVNTGTVVAGAVGGETGQKYTVVGDAVDVASCLAELSGPGEILIGPETLRLVGDILDAEPAGTVTVRGRRDEVPYFRVRDVGPSRSVRETPFGMTSELVGREDQLALFKASLDRLAEGAGSVILVIGEAGIGKSRLTAEVREAATSRGLKWLEGRTLSYGQTMSYLPFKEILQADCGIEADDPMPTRERKLRERMDSLFADRSGEFLPMLANLIGLTSGRPPENPLNWPDEEDIRRMLFDRLARYVSRLGTERPVVIAFEDVHWLDKSSAALIENLFPLTTQAPVAICLKGRGEPGSMTLRLLKSARQNQEVRHVEVQLSPLHGRQTRELIRNLLGRSEIEHPVLRSIQRQSEGNPFFVEEIIRHLIDCGSLQRDRQGTWLMARTSAEAPIPSTLQGVIRARIDRLPEATKQELLRASVIGRSFYYQLLRSLSTADEAELDRHLGYLQDHQLIFVKQSEPELEYVFKHTLVQEAAYDSILTKERRQFHLKVARAIEDLYSGRIKDLYGILAYHYTKAEDWDNAQDYLLRAGDQSVSMAADTEAVAHYQEAMAALLRAFDESWDAPSSYDRVSWFVRRTEPFWLARCMVDLLDPAQVFYERVSTACGPVDPRTLAATTVLAGCYYQRGLYDHAAGIIEKALRSVERSHGEDDPSLGRLMLLLGLCQLNLDRFAEGEDVLARALRLESQRSTAEEGLLQDLHIFLSSAHFWTGRYEDLISVAEEALHKFDLKGTQRYWMLLINLSSSNMALGNWDKAASQARECVDGITNPFLRAIAARHLAEVRHAQRAYLDAEEHLRYAVTTLENLWDPAATAEALKDLAETELQAGKPDKAEETAYKAIKLLETTLSADHSYMAPAYWTLAGIEMGRGELGEAELLLERSAEVVRDRYSPRHPFRAELHFRRAQLQARRGRVDDAGEDYEQAVALLADIGGADHPRIGQMKAEWKAMACQP